MLVCSSVELKVTPEQEEQQEQEEKDSKEIAVYERAKMLDHANIVAVLDYGVDADGKRFVVSQDITGEPLSSILPARGALNALTATAVFIQIADAIEYAAAEGVWIGDLCPDRIFVSGLETGAPIVKITGIGTCENAFEQDISARSLIANENATPYASPERCLGKPTDQRSIIYSIGCMIYEAAYGKKAFEETDQIKLLFDHVNGQALTIPAMTRRGFARLEPIIRKCLQSDPANRFKDLSALRHHLENLEKPIKSENEATKSQMVAMHLSGARTPIGAEMFCIAVFALILVVTNTMMNIYSRKCTALQHQSDVAAMAPWNSDVDTMIDRWKKIRFEGLMLGQPKAFEADCDAYIGHWLQMKDNQTEALAYFRRAASLYHQSSMPAAEVSALDSGILMYHQQLAIPTTVVDGLNEPSNMDKIIPLGHKKVWALQRMYPQDPVQIKAAMLELADMYLTKKDWYMASSLLKAAHNRFGDDGNYDLTWRLAMSLQGMGQSDKAEYWYRRSLELLSSDPWTANLVKGELETMLKEQGRLAATARLP